MALVAPGSLVLTMNFVVYIIWSDSLQKFYVGSTGDIKDRINRHNSGSGHFTSKGIPWKLIWSIELADRSEAVGLENKIKKRGVKRFLEDHKIDFGM